MKVKFFKRNYKHELDSRISSDCDDVIAFHVTGKKYALGFTLANHFSYDRENKAWITWHLLTVKIGRMDYKWRFMKTNTP